MGLENIEVNAKYVVSLLLLFASFGICGQSASAQGQTKAVRATLSNGMRVVILSNTLAPVVTVETNFLVGGDETPPGFPGMAHAQEHMAFRGCAGLTADQTSAIYAQLGGQNNADTQQNITQYFATVPAADLDVALEVEAACMHGIDDSQQEWSQERGAIEQEVARDLSNPTYKFIDRLNEDMFAGTPYAHDPLGTKTSFDATTGDMLKDFYKKWYTPGNAIMVIVGDVDPVSTMTKIRKWFGDVASHPLPERPTVELKPVKSETFTLDSNLPYILGFIAYRFPGTSSPDYAAGQILADVLASQRAGRSSGFMGVDGQTLFEFGAKYRAAILRYGQWWRLVTAGFLHGGLLHIGMNSWVLFDLGAQVEEVFGGSRLIVIYFLATVFGFLASTFWTSAISVGASAGIMGLLGAMIALGVRHQNTAAGAALRGMYVRWAVYVMIFGLLPGLNIDNAAHLGGLAAGFGAAYLAGTPRIETAWSERLWRGAAAACVVLTAASFLMMYLWFSTATQ